MSAECVHMGNIHETYASTGHKTNPHRLLAMYVYSRVMFAICEQLQPTIRSRSFDGTKWNGNRGRALAFKPIRVHMGTKERVAEKKK